INDITSTEDSWKAAEVGRGVIDIPKFLRTLVKIRYSGVVSFEYVKDPDAPLPGLAESVGYVRGVLATI
ncbi:MAG: sugar phosphate isomerase/epimerase, partial [Pirellulales bacterium]|nr:sugar phosphate isomerase/epimerase [Pirellulales bacterium]